MRTRAPGRLTRVLILTGEAELARLARAALEPFCTVTAASPASVKLSANQAAFDIVLVDLEPFDLDVVADVQRLYPAAQPIAICRERREADCIAVLEKGADYLARPFRKRDLLARVRVAELRLFNAGGAPRYYGNGPLVIDLFDRKVLSGGQPVALSPSQLRVLILLASRPGAPVGYDRILAELGQSDSPSGRRALHSLVLLLRRRIERDPEHPEVLLVEAGFGYRLAAPQTERPSPNRFEGEGTTGKPL